MTICTFLNEIPDVIWSGVIASVLTLSGVLLSNWSNTNRLKLQLKHDSEEKAKQRKADLRKDVYLLAAEELVKANAHLASLPQADLTKVNAADGLQGFFSSATKLQMICETKTSLLVSELVGAYGELLLKVLSKVQPIQHLQTEIAIHNDYYNQALSEVSRVLAAMTQFNESAKSDDAVFDALNRSFEFQQGQANKFAEERSELWRQRNALHLAFAREFIAEMKLIGERGMYVMVEIRRELDVGGDINEFLKQMNKQWQRMSAQLDAFLNSLEHV